MSPGEFTVRISAADARFARALERDDIRGMRAALAEKTALLDDYFAVPQRHAGKHDVRAHASPHFSARDPLFSPATSEPTDVRKEGSGA